MPQDQDISDYRDAPFTAIDCGHAIERDASPSREPCCYSAGIFKASEVYPEEHPEVHPDTVPWPSQDAGRIVSVCDVNRSLWRKFADAVRSWLGFKCPADLVVKN